MGKAYDDARFGIEKVLFFPISAALTTATTIGAMYFTEDITITEFGFFCTTNMSGAAAVPPTIKLIELGGTALVTLTLPTSGVVGSLTRTASIDTGNSISVGDTLVCMGVATAGAGVGVPYIKYKPRY